MAGGLQIAKQQGDRVMAGMLELNRIEGLIGQERWRPARQSVKNVLKMAAGSRDLAELMLPQGFSRLRSAR